MQLINVVMNLLIFYSISLILSSIEANLCPRKTFHLQPNFIYLNTNKRFLVKMQLKSIFIKDMSFKNSFY